MILVGSGGHAKVVYQSLLSLDYSEEITLRDKKIFFDKFFSIETLSPEVDETVRNKRVHICIGNNIKREEFYFLSKKFEATVETIIDCNAIVSSYSKIDQGSYIAAGAVIAPNTKIGLCSIINHNAVVDHDCKISNFCHIAPSCTLGGGVEIGERSLIGSGTTVLPNINIGTSALVGSGSIVTKDVPDGSVWIGLGLKNE